MSVIKCPNEVLVHLCDDDKALCDLICQVGKMSQDEFFHAALDFYGRAVYNSLCSLSFHDVPFVKS